MRSQQSRRQQDYDYADPKKFVPRRPPVACPATKPVKDNLEDLSDEVEQYTEPTDADGPYAGKTAMQAIFKYKAKSKLELDLDEYDRLTLLDRTNDHWWFVVKEAEGQRKTGYVPASFVAFLSGIENEPWFFGELSRETAQALLQKEPRGTFLVRCQEGVGDDETVTLTLSEGASASSKNSGAVAMDGSPLRHNAYLLSVRTSTNSNDGVKHYDVRHDPRTKHWYLHQDKHFSSIKKLIEYYKTVSTTLTLLCTRLSKPCPQPKDLAQQTNKSVWELKRKELIFSEKLGEGNFGEVWKATYNSLIPVAVKVLKAQLVGAKDFLQEAQIMKTLDHPYLVKLIGVCTAAGPVYIVTEYMANGNLRDYLIVGEGRHFQVKQLLQMIREVAEGMSYLELKGIVHRDLACRNILVGYRVGEVPTVKIADFGLAKFLDDGSNRNSNSGGDIPVKWSAPEVLTQHNFSTKSDVWSFGILMYEVLTKGKIPYPLLTNKEVNEKIPQGYRMELPQDYPSKDLFKLSERCWREMPEARPSFGRLTQHFKLYDDRGCLRRTCKGSRRTQSQRPYRRRKSSVGGSRYPGSGIRNDARRRKSSNIALVQKR